MEQFEYLTAMGVSFFSIILLDYDYIFSGFKKKKKKKEKKHQTQPQLQKPYKECIKQKGKIQCIQSLWSYKSLTIQTHLLNGVVFL